MESVLKPFCVQNINLSIATMAMMKMYVMG